MDIKPKRVDRRRGAGPTLAATIAMLSLIGLVFSRSASLVLWLILVMSAVYFVCYHLELNRALAQRAKVPAEPDTQRS